MKYFWVVAAVFILLTAPAVLMLSRSTAQEQPTDLAREPQQTVEPAKPQEANADKAAAKEREPVRIERADQLEWDASEKMAHLSGGGHGENEE